ncbi:MAG: hypothetical protein R3A51_05430 [Nannocystaceae bacterium]|nr:hypothetical protein [Myxococcales bacterium]
MTITLQTFNLADAERTLCEQALRTEGTLVGAAMRLGITRHSLKRRILKHDISWPIPRTGPAVALFHAAATQSTPLGAPHTAPRTSAPTVLAPSAPSQNQ